MLEHASIQVKGRGSEVRPSVSFFLIILFLFQCLSAMDDHEHPAMVPTRTSTHPERERVRTGTDGATQARAGAMRPRTSANRRGRAWTGMNKHGQARRDRPRVRTGANVHEPTTNEHHHPRARTIAETG